MTDRDKLIELIEEWHRKIPTHYLADYLLANGVFILPEDLRGTEDFSISAFIEAMQMYKEKDRYIKPPCKVGDTVYTYGARRVKEWVITFCGKNSRGEYYFRAVDEGFKNLLEFWGYEINFKIFLTKEDAVEKLKELGKDEKNL